ncbi:MAG: nitroreductase [Burkholderiaceae bacterium]
MMDFPNSYRHVDEAIESRRSIRAFLPTPVPAAVVEDILRVASRAPSGTNTQPWKVRVVAGDAKAGLSERILAAFNDSAASANHVDEYDYYPSKWVSPYIDRRRKVGWDMYGLLGIGRDDKAEMHAQHARNYQFFDAPVGLVFTIDRIMNQGSWLDYGMFIQSVMVAARGRGLDTCPQVAFTRFHRIISSYLEIPDEEMIVCAMSLGHADPQAVVNQLKTERAPVAEFTKFVGFDT